jgi:hypothetical protein
MTRIGNGSYTALFLGVAALALAALADGANAQITSAQQSAIRASCRSDFMSKCSGVTPGGKDALNCLQKNVAALSPACQTAVSATIPAPVVAKPVEAAPPPTPAVTVAPPPSAKPAEAAAPPPAETKATPVVSAPQTKAKVAKPKPVTHPAAAAVAAPTNLAPPPPPPPPPKPVAPVISGVVLGRACLRDVLLHCRGFGLREAEKIACLTAYHNSGHRLAPLCAVALKLTPMR